MTKIISRLWTLLDTLRNGELNRPTLLRSLVGTVYPDTPNARRMLDRDIDHLNHLGINIERTNTRPPRYILRGGTPIYTTADLHALSLIRDTFGNHHPQTTQVQNLIARLTAHLTDQETRIYEERQPLRVPVQPAIDYTPYTELIVKLQTAISRQQILSFDYKSPSNFFTTFHHRVEPYEIEYYERHFYFVAYSHNHGIVHDFRIDRIQDNHKFQLLERIPPNMQRTRKLFTFRYRLTRKLAQGEISQRFVEQRVVQEHPNGDVTIEAKCRSYFFIIRTILKYADQAEIIEPTNLRDQMIKELDKLHRLYKKA